MRISTIMGLGAVAVLAGAAWAGAPESPATGDKPHWHNDLAPAQEQARREHRPILAVLH
jgi:hypothetical protein